MSTESSNPWKETLNKAGDLWHQHIGSRLASDDSEPERPEQIAIAVEDLGSGMLNAIKYGLAPIGAFGSYTLKGAQYAAQDSASLVMKGVNKAKDMTSRTDSDADCISCESGCCGSETPSETPPGEPTEAENTNSH